MRHECFGQTLAEFLNSVAYKNQASSMSFPQFSSNSSSFSVSQVACFTIKQPYHYITVQFYGPIPFIRRARAVWVVPRVKALFRANAGGTYRWLGASEVLGSTSRVGPCAGGKRGKREDGNCLGQKPKW